MLNNLIMQPSHFYLIVQMLEIISHFFHKHIAITLNQDDIAEQLRIASAALLMEMLHAEEVCCNEKQQLILRWLEQTYNLSNEQTLALLAIAEHKRQTATDYFEFTHLICDAFNHEQKLQLLETLWQIALLDNKLELDEAYLIDKIARLLFIPHIEVLQVRNRLREL